MTLLKRSCGFYIVDHCFFFTRLTNKIKCTFLQTNEDDSVWTKRVELVRIEIWRKNINGEIRRKKEKETIHRASFVMWEEERIIVYRLVIWNMMETAVIFVEYNKHCS